MAYTGRPDVDWNAIVSMMNAQTRWEENQSQQRERDQRWQEQQKTEALRWQGAQDYQTLTASGVAPQEALRRTASKLFYNEPRSMVMALQEREKETIRPDQLETINGMPFIRGGKGELTRLPPEDYGSVSTDTGEGIRINRPRTKAEAGAPVLTQADQRNLPAIVKSQAELAAFDIPEGQLGFVPEPWFGSKAKQRGELEKTIMEKTLALSPGGRALLELRNAPGQTGPGPQAPGQPGPGPQAPGPLPGTPERPAPAVAPGTPAAHPAIAIEDFQTQTKAIYERITKLEQESQAKPVHGRSGVSTQQRAKDLAEQTAPLKRKLEGLQKLKTMAPLAVNEVAKQDRNTGRIGIFDRETKKFLRYAD